MSAPKPDAPSKPAADAPKDAGAPAGKSGLAAFLPLIITVVAMPLLAYVTTTFLILPKLHKTPESAAEEAPAAKHESGKSEGAKSEHGASKEKASAEKSGGHGGSSSKKKSGEKGKVKQSFAFSKMVVNVAGTMGTRYLVVSFSLVGTSADFKTNIEENKDQLSDLAISTLGSKTIVDMERPEAKNQLRSELISAFNSALGGDEVQELFFTEFAMQ